MARAVVVGLALALCSTSAYAQQQQEPRVGIVMGYPAAVGVLWNMTDRIAVRPELSVTRNTADSTTLSGVVSAPQFATTEGWSVGFGLSALFYITHTDAFRMYVSPRFAYTRSTSNNSATGAGGTQVVTSNQSVTATYSGSGSLGAQYSLHRRFAVFGELGFAYNDNESATSSDVFRVDTSGKTVGFRSGAGVIVFF